MKAEIKITIKEELLNELAEQCHISTVKELEGVLKATFFASVGDSMNNIGDVEIVVTENIEDKVYVRDEITRDDVIEADSLFGKATYDPYNCRTTIVCPKCGHEHGFLGRFLVNGHMVCEHCGRSFDFCYEEM